MPPFRIPNAILTGFKERVESLTVQDDRLYIGTAIGSIHIYNIGSDPTANDGLQAELFETKKGISRRAIEDLAYVKSISSLVVLADSILTLYPLPGFSPPTPLPKTKGALSFAVHNVLEQEAYPTGSPSATRPALTRNIPVMATYLAVGCKRKIVWYSWKDGEPQEAQEVVLPHSPRTVVFLDSDTLCLGYTPTDYVLFSLNSRTTTEIVTPVPAAASTGSMGIGALSGWGGYMTLGLGAKQKPCVIKVTDTEVLIARDNNGLFVGKDGKQSRATSIDWPAPPEETALVQPYVFSVLPAGTVPSSQVEGVSGTQSSNPPFIGTTVVEIRSSISLAPVQTLPVPFVPPSSDAPQASTNQTVRVLTASSAKSPLFLVTTPTDRATSTAEGSVIWQFHMKPWGEQVDELIAAEAYANALSLLETVEVALLPDKEERLRLVRALHAVSEYRAGHFKDAISAFIDLNINPAKVVALYPESIAGRLSVPQEEWIPLFGGPRKSVKSETGTIPEGTASELPAETEASDAGLPPPRPPSPVGSVRDAIRTGLESIVSAVTNDDETASIRSKRKEPPKDDLKRAIEELMRYLSDRRPKVAGALEALNITKAQAHEMPYLSAASIDDLFALPNAPLTSLTPEQLVRFSQIVDTALFKSYLIVRPGLLASLCRVANWCEVSEVEEVLRSREKFQELIYLYNGKKMHGKALNLLRQLSESEVDMREKLMPSVQYLQRLGPEHLDQIFESSHWVFEQDPDIAFEIFTSEDVELPRLPVADYLELIDPTICARFVEFLIAERGELSPMFHDRLAELYLRMTVNAKKRGDNDTRKTTYSKLLNFIDTTHHYRPDRLFGLLPPDDLYEAKAILMGRLGRHDNALEIYVYRLQDYLKAEEYCRRVYDPDGPTSNVFLALLRIYLRPMESSSTTDLLRPALDLISRHSPRLDSVKTLELLPPLVTAKDVRTFLIEALRAPIFDRKVIKNISNARDDQVARGLMILQGKRVKVTDSRICPQCNKRLGHSVIAVHAPRGEVTHYQCREAFSRKLKEMRI